LKKPIKVAVHDMIPYLWLSDGTWFLDSQFTKEAINEFRKNHTTHKFSGLKDKVLLISKWHLIIKQVDSKSYYTSY
jgi:hypothetical protein